ncbi:17266_t:CDS:1, partial [Funneliformis geosporum]
VNEMQQKRLKSVTSTINTLVQSCSAFQSILLNANLLLKEQAATFFPL